jgi:putative membrane protein
MRLKPLIGWSIGLLVLLLVLSQQDYPELGRALARAGPGLLLVLLLEPLLWLSHALAWQPLFPRGARARLRDTWAASAIASAVNNLLPVFAVGGDLIKARHLVQRGVRGSDATAAGIVDLSLHGVSALGWSLAGLVMLGRITTDAGLFAASVGGIVLLGGAIGAFIGLQMFGAARFGQWLQRRFAARGWNVLADDTASARQRLDQLWRRPGTLAGSVAVRLAGRALMVPELVFVTWLLGARVGLGEAVLITGLVILVKTVGFVVPARIGVQEGAFLAAGGLIGAPAELMFGAAIAVRLRETVASLPVLLWWYFGEWRRAL